VLFLLYKNKNAFKNDRTFLQIFRAFLHKRKRLRYNTPP